jgi:hypothetical protein
MIPARRVALVLSTASLIVPAGALAQGAGGAGDDQYTDPFAGQGSSSSSSGGSGNSGNNGSQTGGDNGLSQNPDLSGGNGTSTTSGSGSSSSGTGTSATGTSSSLANTGTDLRLMFLAGVTLVLAGTGLRLRTADEKF